LVHKPVQSVDAGNFGARSADEAESILDAIHRAGLADSLRNLQAFASDSPESIQEMRRVMLHEVTMKLQSMIGNEAMDSFETKEQFSARDPREEWTCEEQAPWQMMLPQQHFRQYPEKVMTAPDLGAVEQEGYHRSMSSSCPASLPNLEELVTYSHSGRAQTLHDLPLPHEELVAQSRSGRAQTSYDLPLLREELEAHGHPGRDQMLAQSHPSRAQSLNDLPLLREETLAKELMTHGRPGLAQTFQDLPLPRKELVSEDFGPHGRTGEAKTCPELPLVFEDVNMVMRMSL
jgi:hypothetical protein